MLPEGVHHWTATHPEWEGPVSAYAIDDGERLILIDPIAVPDDVRALFGSREVVTVLTSTWHERDAASLGFPVWAPAPDRPEDQLVPATRYAIGDSLFGLEAYPGREGQLDLVLWSERIRAVIAGDTLIDLGNGLEIPASWLPEGVTVEQVATGLGRCSTSPSSSSCRPTASPPTARLSNAPSPDPSGYDASSARTRCPRRPATSASPSATKPALARTLWEATFSSCPRTQPAHAMLRCRQPAQLPHACRRHTSSRDSFRHPIADLGGAVRDVVDVEPAKHRAVVVQEHVVGV